ncbi:MAG TPA: hypothetical protein VFI73_04050 [Candidatus Nitrosopolaris sp.]|nr:hypothetical protein [Candidatus Nitrosopolaris sp.]
MIEPTAAKRYMFTGEVFVVKQGILSVLELTCLSLFLEVKLSRTYYSGKYFFDMIMNKLLLTIFTKRDKERLRQLQQRQKEQDRIFRVKY